MTREWGPDTVLPGFEATTLPLGSADDGPLVATLVRLRSEQPVRRAVLYVHGYLDYFFQSHVAEALVEFGWNFYALDLRRYGRSLRPGHRPNYCTSIADYDAEISAAIGIVHDEETHDTLVLMGHSTGGLTVPLYAHRGAARNRIDGIVLNSPFFRFFVPNARKMMLPVAGTVGAVFPWGADPTGISPYYGESLLQAHHGEWTYDTRWKPLRGFPVFFGWVRAVRAAQKIVARGLSLSCPVLLLHASASMMPGKHWSDEYLAHDIVLDVDDMRRIGPGLGRDVTMREISGGVHDLFLSREPARSKAVGATLAWLDARFPAHRDMTSTRTS